MYIHLYNNAFIENAKNKSAVTNKDNFIIIYTEIFKTTYRRIKCLIENIKTLQYCLIRG
jgi:hypothetical protein